MLCGTIPTRTSRTAGGRSTRSSRRITRWTVVRFRHSGANRPRRAGHRHEDLLRLLRISAGEARRHRLGDAGPRPGAGRRRPRGPGRRCVFAARGTARDERTAASRSGGSRCRADVSAGPAGAACSSKPSPVGWSRGEVDLIEVPDWEGYAAGWPSLRAPVVARLHGSSSYFAREMNARLDWPAWCLEAASFHRADHLLLHERVHGGAHAEHFRPPAAPRGRSVQPGGVEPAPVQAARSASRRLRRHAHPEKGREAADRSLARRGPRDRPAAELHLFGKDEGMQADARGDAPRRCARHRPLPRPRRAASGSRPSFRPAAWPSSRRTRKPSAWRRSRPWRRAAP